MLINGESRATADLALDITGVFLPKVAAAQASKKAAKNVAAIEDKDPDTTKFLRDVFEHLIAGDALGSQGPIKLFELLASENANGAKTRSYRATFDSGLKARVRFVIDAQGKISTAGVRPE